MIDIVATELTWGLYAFCYAFYLLIMLMYYKKYNTYDERVFYTKSSYVFFFLVYLFVVFSFYTGDFWHYQGFVTGYDESFAPSEVVYEYIRDIVCRNYILFRAVVWGVALYLLLRIIKYYALNRNTTLFCFFALFISVFDYSRTPLATGFYFLGFAYLFSAKETFFKKIVAIALICSSFLFHKSLLPIIIFTVAGFLPINKVLIIFSLIIIPTLSAFLNDFLNDFVLSSEGTMENKISAIQNLDLSSENKSFLEKVRLNWEYLTFYIPFSIVTKIFINNIKSLPSNIVALYKILFIIVMFASTFWFIGYGNKILFYRYLYMIITPLVIIICYFREKQLMSYKTYIFIILFSTLLQIFTRSKALFTL